jgi:hypothetical protein
LEIATFTHGCTVVLFYVSPEDGNSTGFRNVVLSKKTRRWTKSKRRSSFQLSFMFSPQNIDRDSHPLKPFYYELGGKKCG